MHPALWAAVGKYQCSGFGDIRIQQDPVSKEHDTNLWTGFLHKALLHEVTGQFGHQLEKRNKRREEDFRLLLCAFSA